MSFMILSSHRVFRTKISLFLVPERHYAWMGILRVRDEAGGGGDHHGGWLLTLVSLILYNASSQLEVLHFGGRDIRGWMLYACLDVRVA